ncbi:MAG: AMP-dependent synthetase, partial [Gemmatimonadaceae bacterium]
EAVILVAEAKRHLDQEQIATEIRTRLFDELGVALSAVEIVEPGVLPKTTSGKLQRAEVRRRFLNGELRAAAC